jgi:uncharacterized membrane protein
VTGRSFFLASFVVFVAALVLAAFLLPERVPMHFGVGGDVDRWASRGAALLTMGLIGGGLAALFGGPAAGIDRVPMRLLNVPHKPWWSATPEREAVLRSRMRTDLHLIGGATLLLLAAVELLTVRAARLDEPHLDGWVWVLLGVYLAAIAALTAYAVLVRYRKDTA